MKNVLILTYDFCNEDGPVYYWSCEKFKVLPQVFKIRGYYDIDNLAKIDNLENLLKTNEFDLVQEIYDFYDNDDAKKSFSSRRSETPYWKKLIKNNVEEQYVLYIPFSYWVGKFKKYLIPKGEFVKIKEEIENKYKEKFLENGKTGIESSIYIFSKIKNMNNLEKYCIGENIPINEIVDNFEIVKYSFMVCDNIDH